MTNGTGNAYTNGGPPPTRGPRNKVRFTANIPQTFQLERDPPNEAAPSQYNAEEFMYSITGGFVLFAPAELHIEILRTRAKAHHTITVVKRSFKNAAGTTTTWEVENNTMQEQGWQQPTPSHATPPDPRRQETEHQPARRTQPPLQTPPEFPAVKARPSARPAAEALRNELNRPARAEALPAFALSNNPMTHALRLAMEAVKEAQFDEASREDIRALAITIYIQAANDGQR
jgi:hypothetical protein